MLAAVLMVASAAILFVSGVLHLKATFFDSDLLPRDPALQKRMREISPVVTQETDMWSCWIGFNAGLSIGFMLYGLVYGFLAIAHGSLLFGSPYLLVVGLLVVGAYVALSKAYMFSFPLVITGVSLACFVASVIVSLA
jgi:tetrahydromethanopterin S-methyltransferase subunit G